VKQSKRNPATKESTKEKAQLIEDVKLVKCYEFMVVMQEG
jgi:hypothetical protein